MPEFILDTGDENSTEWFNALDEMTQGYVECVFFCGMPTDDHGDDLRDFSLGDLASETCKRIEDDCAAFLAKLGDKTDYRSLYADLVELDDNERINLAPRGDSIMQRAGRDFWYTRNGHGVGFWEPGRWPEGLGDKLNTIAKSFCELDVYLGDDDKLYIS